MGKALNRGKVVGPVPWPLWPYVRGTGRAGMGHTPPLNLGVVGESMWSPASRSQATLYRNLTRLEHAGPPGPRGRQGQRTRARRAGARQGPRDGQTERGKAQSRARPQDFFKMFSASLGHRDLPLSLAAQPRSFGMTALRVVRPTVSALVQVPRTPRKLPPNCGE